MRALPLLLAVAACGTTPNRPQPAPPVGAAPQPPPPPAAFLLPAIAGDADLRLAVHEVDGKRPPRWKGKLVVDGHVTDAPWPEHRPAAHRIDDDRWLLHDIYNEYRLYIWERSRARLTDLGRGSLVAAPGFGQLVVPFSEQGEPPRFCEIHPKRPELRTIWQPEKSRDRATVIGAHDGAIVIAQHALTWGGNYEEDATLFFVTPEETTERTVALRGYRVANGDAIRGGRILLLGQRDVGSTGGPTQWQQPFGADLALYDLATDEIRELDRATGHWTRYTAIPHPYVTVQWADDKASDDAPSRFGTNFECVTFVMQDTEEVRASGCTDPTILNATNSVP